MKTRFKLVLSIEKTLDKVYESFIDPNNMVKWTPDLHRVEIKKGKFGEPGSILLLYYEKNGKVQIMKEELISLEPGKKIISSISGGGIVGEVIIGFKERNNNTEIEMSWAGKGKNLFMSLILILMKNKIKKQALEEMNLFKALVEDPLFYDK